MDHWATSFFMARGLSSIDTQIYVEIFEEHAIMQDDVAELTHELLKEMGIELIGHRIKILKALRDIAEANNQRQIPQPTVQHTQIEEQTAFSKQVKPSPPPNKWHTVVVSPSLHADFTHCALQESANEAEDQIISSRLSDSVHTAPEKSPAASQQLGAPNSAERRMRTTGNEKERVEHRERKRDRDTHEKSRPKERLHKIRESGVTKKHNKMTNPKKKQKRECVQEPEKAIVGEAILAIPVNGQSVKDCTEIIAPVSNPGSIQPSRLQEVSCNEVAQDKNDIVDNPAIDVGPEPAEESHNITATMINAKQNDDVNKRDSKEESHRDIKRFKFGTDADEMEVDEISKDAKPPSDDLLSVNSEDEGTLLLHNHCSWPFGML